MAHACSKILLLLLNVLLITLGVALIVLSFYIYDKYHSSHLIIGIIVLAFIVAAIGLLGLVGVLKQSKCALLIYLILVGLITLALVILLLVMGLRQEWFVDQVVDSYEKFIQSPKVLEKEENLPPLRDFLMKLDCCGFGHRNEPRKVFDRIPFCVLTNSSKPLCNEEMRSHLNRNLSTIMIILGIVTGLGALACVLAMYLTCSTRR